MIHIFNLTFLNPENEECTEEFYVEDADFVSMFNRLVSSFGGFCSDHYGDAPCWICKIEEEVYNDDEDDWDEDDLEDDDLDEENE